MKYGFVIISWFVFYCVILGYDVCYIFEEYERSVKKIFFWLLCILRKMFSDYYGNYFLGIIMIVLIIIV